MENISETKAEELIIRQGISDFLKMKAKKKAEIKKHLEEHFIRYVIQHTENEYETYGGNFITRQDDCVILVWTKDSCGTIRQNEFILEK